jgi:putative pyruvate formate lyase activating enzyme
MIRAYAGCALCPRGCGADRGGHQRGFCGETAELRIASAVLHRGEEPPVTGERGSGAIFFTGCALRCVFCQNAQISRSGMGRAVDRAEFIALCLALQTRGAENVNLVTGSHCAPVLAEFLRSARDEGLVIPILWNSSSYESPEALALMKDLVDVYLPDQKTLAAGLSGRFFKAPEYPEAAEQAILHMLDYRGHLRWKGSVLASGVIIRHLVLPGHSESTLRVLQWFADHCTGRALLSLMTQYTPAGSDSHIPRGYVSRDEYNRLIEWLEELEIEDGFCQEPEPGSAWLPDFGRTNPFLPEFSVPVWHWKTGLLPDTPA